MALKFICDCGKEKAMDQEDLVQMGVSKKMYCKGACEEKVQAFLDARDKVHEKTRAYWEREMKKLYTQSKGFQLPDQDLWQK